MISRKEAIVRLYDVMNSGILAEDLENDLQEIVNWIDYEQYGLHLWSAPDEDVGILATSMRTDLPEFEDFIKKQNALIKKYSFTPSEAEDFCGRDINAE